MATKKTVAEQEEPVETDEVVAENKATPQPGDVIKEYVQNGLRYKRVATENGASIDVRA